MWRLLGLPILLLVLAVLGVAALPILLTGERLRVGLESELSSRLGVQVEIRSLEYHPWSGLTLRGLRVGPPDGFREDLLRLDELRLAYDLSGLPLRRLRIDALALVRPSLTLEARAGRTNLDAVLAHLSAGRPPEPEVPPAPIDRTGPLLPLDLDVGGVRVEDLQLRRVGDGPQALLSGLDLGLDAEAGRRRIDARLRLGDGLAGRAGRIALQLPREDGPPLQLRADLRLTVSATAAAASDAGLSVESSGVALRLGLEGLAIEGSGLPPVDLAAGLAVRLEPTRDAARVEDAGVWLDDRRLAALGVDLDGVAAVVLDILGAEAGPRLLAQLGWSARRGPGRLRLELDRLGVELAALQPHLSVLLPGARSSGRIELGPVRIEGTRDELLAGAPTALLARLAVDELALAWPARGLALGRLGGRVELGVEPGTRTATGTPVTLSGHLAARGVQAPGLELDGAELELGGRVDGLAYPRTGQSRLRATLDLDGLVAADIELPSARLVASAEGVDPLSAARSGAPVHARVDLELPRLRRGGTSPVAVDALSAQLDLRADRVLVPAEAPVTARARVRVGAVEIPGPSLRISELELQADARSDDPRGGDPITPILTAVLRLGRVTGPDFGLDRAELRTGLRAAGLSPLGPGSPLPGSVTGTVALRLPSVRSTNEALGPTSTSLELDLGVNAAPAAHSLELRGLRLRLAELARVEGRLAVRDYLAPRPELEAELRLRPVKLADVLSALPPRLAAQLEGATASGTLGLEARLRGRAPAPDAPLDLGRSELELSASARLDGIGLEAPSAEARLDGLDGRLDVRLRRGRVDVDGRLGLAELRRAGASPVRVESLTLMADAGLAGDTWRARVEGRAGTVEAGAAVGQAHAAEVELDLRYPRWGDVELRELSLRVPGSGVEVEATGRLRRAAFGVLRPTLELKGRVDLDRLKALVPAVTPGGGVVRLDGRVEAPDDRRLVVDAHLGFERASWVRADVAARGIHGALPVRQVVRLPAPRLVDVGARGLLGDDLERRLERLQRELLEEARLVAAPDNILVRAPLPADYESMRPFYVREGARLTVDVVESGRVRLDAVSVDAMYEAGVVRLDRLAFRVLEGDVFGDLALQVGAPGDLRLRTRLTATDLDLDLATAPILARERLPPHARERFRLSGVSDLRVDVGEGTINGTLDVTKVSAPLAIRLLQALDPKDEDANLRRTRLGLSVMVDGVAGWALGEELRGVKVWIRENLLNQTFVWSRPWFALRAPNDESTAWVPLIWLPAMRVAQYALVGIGEALDQKIVFSVADAVPEVRRRNLAEMNPTWERLRRELRPVQVRFDRE